MEGMPRRLIVFVNQMAKREDGAYGTLGRAKHDEGV